MFIPFNGVISEMYPDRWTASPPLNWLITRLIGRFLSLTSFNSVFRCFVSLSIISFLCWLLRYLMLWSSFFRIILAVFESLWSEWVNSLTRIITCWILSFPPLAWASREIVSTKPSSFEFLALLNAWAASVNLKSLISNFALRLNAFVFELS